MSSVLIFSDKNSFYEHVKWNPVPDKYNRLVQVFPRMSSDKVDLSVVDLSVDDPSTAGLEKLVFIHVCSIRMVSLFFALYRQTFSPTNLDVDNICPESLSLSSATDSATDSDVIWDRHWWYEPAIAMCEYMREYQRNPQFSKQDLKSDWWLVKPAKSYFQVSFICFLKLDFLPFFIFYVRFISKKTATCVGSL